MHVTTICGSVREGSMTLKAAKRLTEHFATRGAKTSLLCPRNVAVESLGGAFPEDYRDELHRMVTDADGIALCTPEYHGCFSSILMAVIENLGFPSILQGKPVVLLGAAAGRIGAIKALEHLRNVCSHCGAIVLPSSVSIANVHRVFQEDGSPLPEVDQQIDHVAAELMSYLGLRRQ